ncbi:putative PurR-regulated permease PerM [Asanoa ferruginea]|uniref:Putative PurR-regulated permease PerM n=1 Tax=Asanoa ferruginea TaxID=53367 RepID=A0A3D9ZDZ3_9ACTN|nr:AI-2E family transporter [Asanoa ferruginea]REF94672.1 putative PurR-regulated permease PerM [Asanoa ferruginea]GIF45750.1 AI-2E family transporter [Asanoa ferruginea]
MTIATQAARWVAERRAAAARDAAPPPFVSSPLVVVRQRESVDDDVPQGLRAAAAWAWRGILLVVAAYLLLKVIGLLSAVVIPIAVAVLLAALLEPAAAGLRARGMNRSLASALVLVTGLVVVFGGLGLIVWTFVSQLDELAAQVRAGVGTVEAWLANGPLAISQVELSAAADNLQRKIAGNQSAVASGALSTAATAGELLGGFFLVLFSLFFFLRDGARIWRFLCRLLPRAARLPTARAGHYAWHTLVSYVRATVFVAFVDAVGIGAGLLILRVPLALPLTALVFLSSFIPVIGATVSGVVAVLVALVANGPVAALIVLAIVIGVQQLEGNVLQPMIMGRAVSLHPLAILLAISIGIVVAGVVGGLVAVPILAVANTAIRYLLDQSAGSSSNGAASPSVARP